MTSSNKASSNPPMALNGLTVLQIGGGAAAGYCGRMLVDAGARVLATSVNEEEATAGVLRADSALERAYAQYLDAGKRLLPPVADAAALARMCANADIVLIGERSSFDPALSKPKIGTIDVRWYSRNSAYRDWQGSDLLIQSLSATPHFVGHENGPPLAAGDRQATTIGGVLAYIATCAAILAAERAGRFAPGKVLEVSILDANALVSEFYLHLHERDLIPSKRWGLNVFAPNVPLGIYPCKQGHVGITVATPDQWRSLCAALSLGELLEDPTLTTREARFERFEVVEGHMCRALAGKSAMEWAEIGRDLKIPMVVVPDAAGILDHPIFKARNSLVELALDDGEIRVPRTPLAQAPWACPDRLGGIAGEQTDAQLDPQAQAHRVAAASSDNESSVLLAGLKIVDFSMGWAGPLATRLLADLGATVLKVEAGRYPDWWRGLSWSADIIQQQLYEKAKGFTALNRGKLGVSVDLTTPAGKQLAFELVRGADAVVENQAAGIMDKLGLGYAQFAGVNPAIVMMSMSAFGSGNAWSDTRAYGSTLEQGSGLPNFMGDSGTVPTMAHIAYGDPVGGLYGCAALLTALVQRERCGGGQFLNVSMVEAMLQLTTPGLIEHQMSPGGAVRRGNQSAVMAPHGIFPSAGFDQWVAIAVEDERVFTSLAKVLGRLDWADDPSLRTLEGRTQKYLELSFDIASWTRRYGPAEAAGILQAAGVAAAPVLRVEEMIDNDYFTSSGFFGALDREISGPQIQMGVPIMPGHQRLRPENPAPLLGEHSRAVLREHAGVSEERYDELVRQGIVSFIPKPSKNLL